MVSGAFARANSQVDRVFVVDRLLSPVPGQTLYRSVSGVRKPTVSGPVSAATGFTIQLAREALRFFCGHKKATDPVLRT
jgi:hypothetical protein